MTTEPPMPTYLLDVEAYLLHSVSLRCGQRYGSVDDAITAGELTEGDWCHALELFRSWAPARRALTAEQAATIAARRAAGEAPATLAAEYGISVSHVRYLARTHGQERAA